MAQLKRFKYGFQALLVLSSSPELRSSTEIAERINCEPTALRKILAQMADASIVEVRQGRTGGYQLAKQPDQITLFEVYTSLHEVDLLQDPFTDKAAAYTFGGDKMLNSFSRLFEEINEQVKKVLGQHTVAEFLEGG
ncbi:RrF2 family transcriptional regulator [Paenibacillus protaetiae]|uniref:Transcriptional regulator n=1 Tax=Paenibacillus protaetiae TaxID=2509456 RepID=A0A4P6EU71_9BACL|nr:Rrf2 family transcriptional regulator [Paenibacillus protaetiae]QAY66492.1 transcriptional regulator [Paenibacillus protaetiae]